MSAVRLFNLGVFLIVLSLVFPTNACCDQPEKPRESLKILFAGDIMLDGGPGNFVANGKDPFAACVAKAIKNAKGKLGCDVVIPFLHWGQELTPAPRPDQAISSRTWIDAGATAVIGAHPHVTQTVETYRGSPIIYSLGNFAFDYFPVDPPEWTGWVAVLEIEPTGAVGLEIKTIILDAAGCPKPAPMD